MREREVGGGRDREVEQVLSLTTDASTHAYKLTEMIGLNNFVVPLILVFVDLNERKPVQNNIRA